MFLNVIQCSYMLFNQNHTMIDVMNNQNDENIRQVKYFIYLGGYIKST